MQTFIHTTILFMCFGLFAGITFTTSWNRRKHTSEDTCRNTSYGLTVCLFRQVQSTPSDGIRGTPHPKAIRYGSLLLPYCGRRAGHVGLAVRHAGTALLFADVSDSCGRPAVRQAIVYSGRGARVG